jgi:hypothetical protein
MVARSSRHRADCRAVLDGREWIGDESCRCALSSPKDASRARRSDEIHDFRLFETELVARLNNGAGHAQGQKVLAVEIGAQVKKKGNWSDDG